MCINDTIRYLSYTFSVSAETYDNSRATIVPRSFRIRELLYGDRFRAVPTLRKRKLKRSASNLDSKRNVCALRYNEKQPDVEFMFENV